MVVDITVAEVTEGQGADAGESRGETARIFGDEARHQVDRDADVRLKRRTIAPLLLRDRIAQAPEGSALRFVLRQNDIVDQPGFENGGEFGHELCVQIIAIAAGKLDKGVPRVRRIERRARLRNVAKHRVEATVRDDLKTFERKSTRLTSS